MKYVLLIVDGDIALHFLQKIMEGYSNHNFYIVLYKDSRFLPKVIPHTFEFHQCDYTSQFRLDSILIKEISIAFIVLDNEKESKFVYQYLRENHKRTRIIQSIYTLNAGYENLNKQDSNLVLVTQTNAMASRLLLRLPNIPVIPRGFGLEQGEVMEISIPSGSIFSHRQVGTIQQANWKIVGIYRNNTFILTTSQSVIWPNDILLVAGEPNVLQTIYNRIKSDMGQFPLPFGREICVIVDMCLQNKMQILFDCKEAIYLHRHLKSTKLTIRVLHATDFNVIQEIEQFAQHDIAVTIDYENSNLIQILHKESVNKIGLIVIGKDIFAKRSYRYALWKSNIPVFKTAKKSLSPDNFDYTLPKEKLNTKKDLLYPPNVTESVLIVSGEQYQGSDISTLIFDISKQLHLNVRVYDFEPDNHFSNEVEEEFSNLSRIFERKFYIERNNSNNPIFYLQNLQNPVLHFLPFTPSITKSKISAFINIRFEALACLLDSNPQLFIPTQ